MCCSVPIVLQPLVLGYLSAGKYGVVVKGFWQGSMNSEAFLGQLNQAWRVQVGKNAKKDGYFLPAYCNIANDKTLTPTDPRF